MAAEAAPDRESSSGRIPPARVALIEKIFAASAKLKGRGPAAARRRYLRAYFRGVAEEDLAARPPAALAEMALQHLEVARQRKPGRSSVHVVDRAPSDDGQSSARSFVLVTTDDRPFLVDSLGMVFDNAGIAVHLIVHPVLDVRRARNGRLLEAAVAGGDSTIVESWELYEIDRQTDPERIAALKADLEAALDDVRIVVDDWRGMRRRIESLAESLARDPPFSPPDDVAEARELLGWMAARHFVFLGYRYYRLERRGREGRFVADAGSGLGILRRGRRAATSTPAILRSELRLRPRHRELLVLTKADSPATVHRPAYLDYVGVRTFDPRGRISGEHRFLGLWTSSAYQLSPREIPVLRRKVERIIAHFGLDPQSHDGKGVLDVLETYPRDELFQAPVDDLIRIVRSVVNLYERRTVRLLTRRDPWGRFHSCLIYVPRDRYNTEVRQRIEQIVLDGLRGDSVESQVQISESTHARIHMVVHTASSERRKIDTAAIEARIADAATTWSDRLRATLMSHRDEPRALELGARYASVFPLAYQEDVDPADAIEDLGDLEALRETPQVLRLNLYRPRGQKPERAHLKIVKLGDPVPISDILPTMENFELRLIAERPYELGLLDGSPAWIQDFELEHRGLARIDIAGVEKPFKEAFAAVWSGEVENDGFNRLLLLAGLVTRQIVVLRAYCRFILQTGIPFSQAYMERVLAANPRVARDLVLLYEARFDPDAPRRPARADRLIAGIRAALDAVTSLDEDRILRAFLNAVRLTLRTNFYQADAAGQPKSYLSFKLDSGELPGLPLPRPKFEIFVYSPRVEGIHLRKGHVARGGIRWSDRREDFRTEILGLMKAQNVKNTVIVPVGAKGGFVTKRLPLGSRDEVQREVVACYQTFIRGLLDVTDNIAGGRIVAPPSVVRYDGDDAYLVVAADKGTATFSDIANAISIEYGFWLGDAFASGGSAGYDHKKMAITARGAWESVRRHFREIGVDIQTQDFTACGIGDMSGDVFGNGMLLSRHIRLQAAFNHQHIFIDPAPDAASSFSERARLFALPRSSWDDYDRGKISRGGGIYLRTAKSIPLSAQAQALLGLQGAAAPNDVIRAILRMPVDLLWNGGIGTYVKAGGETNGQVGDRANDAVRINGSEVKAKVAGEGGNLGFSQRGRVEYALSGGRLNTDFIDNSGGVNTSDVEVNIKILLNPLERAGKLRHADRNRLLARMTDEIAALVLRNNYLQGQALSTLELQAASRLTEYQHLIRGLERSGELDRAIEFLPTDDELNERRKAGRGLTRPELAILLSYSKIWLSHHLLSSDVPEDPYLSAELARYFPKPVRARFPRQIERHRLRREIIATATTNSLVNRMGPVFVPRAQEETGAGPAQIARAYSAAREIFDMRELWARIEALDNRIPASLQYSMMYETGRLLRHVSYWLLSHRRHDLQVQRAVKEFRPGVAELVKEMGSVLQGVERLRFESLVREQTAAGIPADLAPRIAALASLDSALDIVEIGAAHRTSVRDAARVYFELGTHIGLDWLRESIQKLSVEGAWHAFARAGLRDSAMRLHRRLAEHVLARTRKGSPTERVEAWAQTVGRELDFWQRMLAEMRAAGASDFATLTVGVESVRKLAD